MSSSVVKNNFYVYFHRLKSNGEIFYIGKGIKNRVYSKCGRNKLWREIVKNKEWFYEKYIENLDEQTALDIELQLIQKYKPACNIHIKDIRKKEIDIEFINKRYEYSENSKTGLSYKESNNQGGSKLRNKGDSAGNINSNGYYIVYGGKNGNVLVHRVIWLLLKKEDPGQYIIDHIDGNRLNNNIKNLRKVGTQENSSNSAMRHTNSTGLTGVQKRGNLYIVTCKNGDSILRKTFSILKFGDELALELACYFRLQNISRDLYSDRHIGTFDFKILNSKSDEEIQNIINDESSWNNSRIKYVYYNKNGFWEFRYNKNVKRFSIKKFGEETSKNLAIEYKNRFLGGTPSNISGFSLHETTNMLNSNTKYSNTSNIKYISFIEINGNTILVVQKSINRKNFSKRFDCSLGIIKVHAEAMKWINEGDYICQ